MNLHNSFKVKSAIQKVNLNIEAEKMMTIVGASSSGKSTLLRHINGSEQGDKGGFYNQWVGF